MGPRGCGAAHYDGVGTGNFWRFEIFALAPVVGSFILMPIFFMAHPLWSVMTHDFLSQDYRKIPFSPTSCCSSLRSSAPPWRRGSCSSSKVTSSTSARRAPRPKWLPRRAAAESTQLPLDAIRRLSLALLPHALDQSGLGLRRVDATWQVDRAIPEG